MTAAKASSESKNIKMTVNVTEFVTRTYDI